MSKLVTIPVKQIKQNKNYRGHIDVADLMASIKSQGLLQPIGVRPSENGYEIVFGNRRLDAVKKLDHETIPCLILEANDQELVIKNATENIQREDVPIPILGKAFKDLQENYNMSLGEIASKIGVRERFVKTCITSLNHIPEKFHHKIFLGKAGNASTSKGLINTRVAMMAVNLSKTTGIKRATSEEFLNHCLRHGLSNASATLLFKKLKTGLDIKTAALTSSALKRTSFAFTFIESEVERLERRYGKKLSEIAEDILRDHPDFRKVFLSKTKRRKKTETSWANV